MERVKTWRCWRELGKVVVSGLRFVDVSLEEEVMSNA